MEDPSCQAREAFFFILCLMTPCRSILLFYSLVHGFFAEQRLSANVQEDIYKELLCASPAILDITKSSSMTEVKPWVWRRLGNEKLKIPVSAPFAGVIYPNFPK